MNDLNLYLQIQTENKGLPVDNKIESLYQFILVLIMELINKENSTSNFLFFKSIIKRINGIDLKNNSVVNLFDAYVILDCLIEVINNETLSLESQNNNLSFLFENVSTKEFEKLEVKIKNKFIRIKELLSNFIENKDYSFLTKFRYNNSSKVTPSDLKKEDVNSIRIKNYKDLFNLPIYRNNIIIFENNVMFEMSNTYNGYYDQGFLIGNVSFNTTLNTYFININDIIFIEKEDVTLITKKMIQSALKYCKEKYTNEKYLIGYFCRNHFYNEHIIKNKKIDFSWVNIFLESSPSLEKDNIKVVLQPNSCIECKYEINYIHEEKLIFEENKFQETNLSNYLNVIVYSNKNVHEKIKNLYSNKDFIFTGYLIGYSFLDIQCKTLIIIIKQIITFNVPLDYPKKIFALSNFYKAYEYCSLNFSTEHNYIIGRYYSLYGKKSIKSINFDKKISSNSIYEKSLNFNLIYNYNTKKYELSFENEDFQNYNLKIIEFEKYE